MLLWLMIAFAVGAVLLFAMGAFDELRDAWKNPERRDPEDDLHHPRPRLR